VCLYFICLSCMSFISVSQHFANLLTFSVNCKKYYDIIWRLYHRKLRGTQSRSGQHGEEKILDRTGTRTPTPRSSSP
jgi:hypothetical protein